MNTDEIIIVGGLSRCGSSLMMHLLYEAGVPVYCDNKQSFECTTDQYHQKDIFDKAKGCAIKILHTTQNFRLPTLQQEAKVIWLRRDGTQQAQSQVKLLEALTGIMISRSEMRKMALLNIKQNMTIPQDITKRGFPCLIVDFESLIENPNCVIPAISDFISHPLPAEITKIIIPRSTNCMPDLSIELAKV